MYACVRVCVTAVTAVCACLCVHDDCVVAPGLEYTGGLSSQDTDTRICNLQGHHHPGLMAAAKAVVKDPVAAKQSAHTLARNTTTTARRATTTLA